MIPKKDYIELGKRLSAGEQISINHTNCPSGEDKRQRLFVKNTGSAILAYCHNCGDKGYTSVINKLEKKRTPPVNKDVKYVESKPIAEYGLQRLDAPNMQKLFPELVQWIPKHVYEKWGAFVNVNNGRLCLPIINYDKEGKRVKGGWQERKFYNAPVDSVGLKYMTYRFEGCKTWSEFREGEDLVITEDIMSSLSCYFGAKVSAIALMRTTASDELILHIANNYKRVAVWLDPDEAGREAGRKLTERLSLFVPTINIQDVYIATNSEPKELLEVEIKHVLNPTTGTIWKKLKDSSQT